MRAAFDRFAARVATAAGSPYAFAAAMFAIIGWAASGPAFGYSDTWQLVVNTSTTIVTFLMVFVIQASQNRDARAVQLKLDELIRSSEARNALIDIEDADERTMEREREDMKRASRKVGLKVTRRKARIPPLVEG